MSYVKAGLKNVYGKDVIDYPGALYMFKDEVKKKSFDITNLWAKGFTYYDEFDNYESVDRSDVESKIDNNYFVTTIHRPSNLTDENLNSIFTSLNKFTDRFNVILPAHPRLKNYIDANQIKLNNISIVDPMSYVDFLSLVNGSSLVLTDSGGLQEETTFMNINCLTLREETERPITVEQGTNKVVGLNPENIISEINNSLKGKLPNENKIKNWDGNTSERIFNILYKK